MRYYQTISTTNEDIWNTDYRGGRINFAPKIQNYKR